MPFISVHTSTTLKPAQKETLKREMGKLISIIPGKTEAVLMLEFCDNQNICLGGDDRQVAAYIDVKCYKQASFEANQKFTQAVFALMEATLGITTDHMYLTLTELPSWGLRGSMK